MRAFFLAAALFSAALTTSFAAFARDVLDDAEKFAATGAFAEASRAYATFAKDAPKDPRAPRAFATAVILNSRLDQVNLDAAYSNMQDFENTFVPVDVDLWADMVFTLVDGFAVRGNGDAARFLLQRAIAARDLMSVEARKKHAGHLQGLREIEIRLRGRLARLFAKMGDHRGADAEYTKIQKLIAELDIWPGKRPPKNRAKHAETLEFMAETFFHFAEEKRFDAERMTLPAYLGAGDRESILQFINGPGARWYENRMYAVEIAFRAYAFVFGSELPKPVPPKPPPPPSSSGTIGLLGGDPDAPLAPTMLEPTSPEYEGPPFPSAYWAIAAAERMGAIWSNFTQESLRMPIPTQWTATGPIPGTNLTWVELKNAYINALDSPGDALKSRAKQAYRLCANLSIRHHIVNGHTQACFHWLAQNVRAEYHENDEFLPQSEFLALGAVSRPLPLPQWTH